MTEKEGFLRMQPSGRWAACRPGRDPIEITSGDVFRFIDDGAHSSYEGDPGVRLRGTKGKR
jgi:hypothetical protein